MDGLRIYGNPAQRIIDGCLRNIAPEMTLAQMLEISALALDLVVSDSLIRNLAQIHFEWPHIYGHDQGLALPCPGLGLVSDLCHSYPGKGISEDLKE